MKPLKRKPVNKSRSIRKANSVANRTKAINIKTPTYRGGIRL